MPAADSPPNSPIQPNGVTKFINCRLVKGDSLVPGDLLVSNLTGTILDGQEVFYTRRLIPDRIVDLAGRILSPGFIDVQFNGAYGFDFSTIPEDGPVAYGKGALRLNKELVKMGVTSYLPTITSQMPEVYQKVASASIPSRPSHLTAPRHYLSWARLDTPVTRTPVQKVSELTWKVHSSVPPNTAVTASMCSARHTTAYQTFVSALGPPTWSLRAQ